MGSGTSFLFIFSAYNFDDLLQNGFQVIPKIKFANLCKSFHNVIITVIVSDLLSLKNVERKEGNYKNLNILRTKIPFLDLLKAFS